VPFTFSHPGAVVPLRRCKLAFSALVVGSMAPDFEYFFRLTRLGRTSHHFPGIITFTLPVALAVLLIFHVLVKWPVISLLPRGLQARVVAPARQFRWWPLSRFLIILLSLAVGMATHVLADSFTHYDGWAVMHWPSLTTRVAVMPGYAIQVYKLLQFGTSAVGAAMLVGYFAVWYPRAPRDNSLPPQFSRAFSTAIGCAMLAVAVAFGVIKGTSGSVDLVQGFSQWLRFAIRFVITTTSVGALEVFGFSVIWRMFAARNQSRQEARVRSAAFKN
jgi:hypothetical protein